MGFRFGRSAQPCSRLSLLSNGWGRVFCRGHHPNLPKMPTSDCRMLGTSPAIAEHLFRLKALTAAQLLRFVSIALFPSDFGSSACLVLVLEPTMTAPAIVIWAQMLRLENLTKIHRHRFPPTFGAPPTYPLP